MKIEAKQRLLALPKFMYEQTEQEVREHKAYRKCEALANKLVELQRKMKSQLIAFDLDERKIAKRLLTEETGLTFEFTEHK